MGERFWTAHYDIPTGRQTSFYSYSDGLRPEVIQEPTWTRPNSIAAWGATVGAPAPGHRISHNPYYGQMSCNQLAPA
jgi:hypothetical protein